MAIKIAHSLSEYLLTVERVRRSWSVPKWKELWFRAEDESHRKTQLQPGLYRPKENKQRKSVEGLLELEHELYREFGRCVTQLSDVKLSETDWEWDTYFIMQHYGVPTRLLDWSDGALIALHFAVRNKPASPKSGSIIHVLDPYWLAKLLRTHRDRNDLVARWKEYWKKNPREDIYEDEWERLYLPSDEDDAREPLLATPKIPMLWDSPHLTRRVAAQRSRFMIFGTDPLWLSALAKDRNSRLISIGIPIGAVNGIKEASETLASPNRLSFPT